MAVYTWFVITFQVNIAFNPGTEMMGVTWHIIFRLAGFYAAQATNALRRVNAVRPAVFRPVKIRSRER